MNASAANITTARKLLLWNSANLISHADLQKSDLSQFFAPAFRVKANAVDVAANDDNYYDFLNSFRSTIKSINYELDDFIVDATRVVIPMTAFITRLDDDQQTYKAILILGFDENNKINLWQEVYVEIKTT